jgi:hypothetical protein
MKEEHCNFEFCEVCVGEVENVLSSDMEGSQSHATTQEW